MISRRGFLKLVGSSICRADGARRLCLRVSNRSCGREYTATSLTPPGWTAGIEAEDRCARRYSCLRTLDVGRRIASICRPRQRAWRRYHPALGDYLVGMRIGDRSCGSSEDWATELAALTAPLGVHADHRQSRLVDDHGRAGAAGRRRRSSHGVGDVGYSGLWQSRRPLRKGWTRLLACGPGRSACSAQEHPLEPSVRKGLDDLDGTLAQIEDEAPVILTCA